MSSDDDFNHIMKLPIYEEIRKRIIDLQDQKHFGIGLTAVLADFTVKHAFTRHNIRTEAHVRKGLQACSNLLMSFGLELRKRMDEAWDRYEIKHPDGN